MSIKCYYLIYSPYSNLINYLNVFNQFNKYVGYLQTFLLSTLILILYFLSFCVPWWIIYLLYLLCLVASCYFLLSFLPCVASLRPKYAVGVSSFLLLCTATLLCLSPFDVNSYALGLHVYTLGFYDTMAVRFIHSKKKKFFFLQKEKGHNVPGSSPMLFLTQSIFTSPCS